MLQDPIMSDEGAIQVRVLPIQVEALTPDAFRPFGEVLSKKAGPADFHGLKSVGWSANFAISGAPVIMTLSSMYSGRRFSKLERHFRVTQTFVPLSRVPAVVAVAEPTSRDELPQPENVHAFLIDGSAGYILATGTWHSLDRYPLHRPSAEMIIITERATQEELQVVDPRQWTHTQMIDCVDEFGVEFEIDI